ncbi:MAG TPA: hypothetical protein VHC47_09835 [Mucilaginibacter sp.]|nr:hypothetical protein [Mucilaginibacter sp.]
MKIKIAIMMQMGIVNNAKVLEAPELSFFFTGVVGFVGAVAITLVLFSYLFIIKLINVRPKSG